MSSLIAPMGMTKIKGAMVTDIEHIKGQLERSLSNGAYAQLFAHDILRLWQEEGVEFELIYWLMEPKLSR